MYPVPACKASPMGNEPLVIDQVYGVVPPLTVILSL